jgi:hypothetical protein
MFTGGALVVITAALTTKGVEEAANSNDKTNAYLKFGWVLLGLSITPFFVFLDAIRRMHSIKIKNSVISMEMVLVLSVAYLTMNLSSISTILNGLLASANWARYVNTIGFEIGTAILGTLIYRINVSIVHN